jgi:LCP family protein required for cell wall assembly
MGTSLLRKRILVGGALAVLAASAAALFFAIDTWSEVGRVSIDRPSDSEASSGPGGDPGKLGEVGEVAPDQAGGDQGSDELQVFLLVGSDSREDLDNLEGFGAAGGRRADVVMVLFRAPGKVGILSLPRDLWVENPCTDEQSRLNSLLEGCGEETNGATLLTVGVENLIGERIDHFAMVDLAGFQGAVDAIGGYEICVERPVRDRQANLELPAGCTHASGAQTLAWLRSRRTQELTEAGWRIVPGMNDLVRNERQRTFLIDMMGRLSDFSSPQEMAAVGQAVAPFVTVDSELTLLSAVDLAWAMRGLSDGSIVSIEVPVYDFIAETGAAVLKAAVPVREIVAEFLTGGTAGEGLPQAAS